MTEGHFADKFVGMWPYHPELLATPVPRYTSFPTAAEFGPVDSYSYAEALEAVEGEVSLYVHIPFCEKICFYCGCNTGKASRLQRLESYLAALHAEIGLVAARLPSGTKVRRISFGGGSPNAIAPDDFVRLVDELTFQFHLSDPTVSIELDPRTMSAEWAAVIRSVGIDRASLGVQTFATHCQEAIGRVQHEDEIVQTVDWLRQAGVASLNFDLMYGLPGQTRDDLLDTLQRTRVLGANRVALFGYAHVPHMIPRQRLIEASALPGQAERFAMAAVGFEYFVTHGYTPVGFDHFAKPGADPLATATMAGALRRNFQGFTDDMAPNLIGLGSSAISCFPQLLAQNEKNSGRYRMRTSQGAFATATGFHRSQDDCERGKAIEDLLCHGRVRLPSHIASSIACRLTAFVTRGLATLEDDVLTVAPEGLPYTRTIAALIDPYRTVSERRFSAAV